MWETNYIFLVSLEESPMIHWQHFRARSDPDTMTMDGVSVMPSLNTADVDLNSDSDQPLQVDISDALSEKDKVKFTVHTR